MVVPWVLPPPPEIEILPGGIPDTEFATHVSEWRANRLSGQDTVAAARSRWGIHHDDDVPRLRLMINLVGAARTTHSFELLESIQMRLTQTLSSLIQDLLLSAAGR